MVHQGIIQGLHLRRMSYTSVRKDETKALTMKSVRRRYCSGSTTMDAPPAKIKLTEGNISPTLNKKQAKFQ